MERLTEKVGEHFTVIQQRVNGKFVGTQMCFDKLGELEDAEEQGLLLRLPVPIDGTIWTWEYPTIVDEKGEEWTVCDRKRAKVVTKPFNLFMLHEIGHLYFLTRESAEAALAEKGGA